nr:formin-like protein 16 [Aegilops tauschii subsp. strangulata]
MVVRKKKGRRAVAGPAPAATTATAPAITSIRIGAARSRLLNELLGRDGLVLCDNGLGLARTGYEAQVLSQVTDQPVAEAIGMHVIKSTRSSTSPAVSRLVPLSKAARVPRVAVPGFPRIGLRRAARVRPAAAMACRGAGPPPKPPPPKPAPPKPKAVPPLPGGATRQAPPPHKIAPPPQSRAGNQQAPTLPPPNGGPPPAARAAPSAQQGCGSSGHQ